MRSQGYSQPQSLGKGFGDWEKHTKGIGAKLLLNMGFQPGKGLGKALQGRTSVVEAHLRKGKGAIGAYGHEGGRPKKEKLLDSDEEEEKQFKDKLNQWRTGTAVGAKKKNVSYVYKSVDDVLAEGQFRKVDRKEDRARGEGVKVIDMTGREQRVLKGYSAIAGQQRPAEDGDSSAPLIALQEKRKKNFELPELIHNLNLLVDMTEQDIIAADRKLVHHKDRVEVLEREGVKLNNLVEKEKRQIEAMEQIIDVLDKLEEKHNTGELDHELAVKAFTKLKEEFSSEFQEFELSYCAQTVVIPLVKQSLTSWSPLAGRNESLPHLTTFTQWREILEAGGDTQPGADTPMAAYHSLVWESWVPLVRLAVQRWHSRDPQPLVAFLELWRPLVPPWIMQHVLEQLVLARLQAEVEVWDPLTDTTPIHTWLHPWLPPLGDRLECVFPTIRNKLSSALSSWHPTDRSAKLILLPWQEVFSRGSMCAFLTKNIVPKLEQALATLPITPHNQDLTLWRAVTDWSDLLPPPQLAQMLAQSFFPRWLQVLAGWLNSTPNYEEVVGWYSGWKSSLPASVLPLPGVADQLSQALHMMNRSVSGGGPLAGQPGALENVRYMTSREFQAGGVGAQAGQDTGNKNKFATVSEAVKTAAQIPQGFKDLIGRRCEERGIVFRPLAGRWREGKQLYLCGSRQVYLDRNVIFVMEGGSGVWVPTSLNSLLDRAA
eukprot:TRINITY_DN41326_c0_g1_i1.p1 TRINITY_DN41326_c0_g1~~TRINITY_DN41326_c0_g1_i1.p1  ORF type:complete len:713 (+),score=291.77 TRINITY_DN41326_c0_g1_i1:106-2244(+)